MLVGCPQKHIAVLQLAQHALARIVMQQSTRFSFLTSVDFLEQLHLLSVKWRIELLLAFSTYKAIHTGNPLYLAALPHQHKSTMFTRSSTSRLLDVPCHNLSFGSCAFRVSAPQVYNSVPIHIRQAQTFASFKRPFKTYYFQSAYFAP